VDEYEGRGFTSRAFNDPIAKRLNKFSKLSEYTRPHFKPTERTTSSTISSTTTVSSIPTSATFGTQTSFSTSSPSTTTTTLMNTEEISTKPSVTSTSSKSLNNITEIVDGNFAIENTTTMTTTTTTTTTTTLPSVTVIQIIKEQNFSINEIPEQNNKIDKDLKESVELQSEDIVIEVETTLEPISTTNIPTELIDEEEQVLSAAIKTTVHEELIAASSHEQQQQFRPRPEYRPSSIAETSKLAGQLYQDVAAKDQQEQSVLKLRGV